ncbi:MAG: STAS domain-containing protein [Acidimicrobiales bacterium]
MSTDAPYAFVCSKSVSSERTVLVLRGDLDVLSAEEFRDCLNSALAGLAPLIELDFAGLSFIDARGVRELRQALSIVRDRGGDLVITSVPAMAYKVLELTGLTQMLSVE